MQLTSHYRNSNLPETAGHKMISPANMSDHDENQDENRDKKPKKSKLRLCEVLVLPPILLVIIGLFLIPTVQHFLPSGAMVNSDISAVFSLHSSM